MAYLMFALSVLLCVSLSPAAAQAPPGPLTNICRRYGHQTAVLDRQLYIDGGWVYASPLLANPIPTMSIDQHDQDFIYSDLNQVNKQMPKQYANLTKGNNVPSVAGGILWPDEVNKVVWLYGGEFSAAPNVFQLWGYDAILNQWNASNGATSSSSPIQRVSYGAGTVLGGKGYYYGGYLNNLTNPSWNGPPMATNALIMLDMDSGSLTNNTGPDSIGRAEGVMVSIPASSSGMLVYFGGVSFPYGSSTEVAMPMANILLYDVGDAKWYTQTATGQIPPNRRKFCAGATWAADQSSYNIYIYGGFGFGENATGFDDVWILTLPTFEWIKWYPDAGEGASPHGLLTCNVIDNAQMIVMGGNFTNSDICDVPDDGQQHNLNLGELDYQNAKWYQYLPNLTSYSVPSDIISITGGSSGGGATNLSPPNGFDDSALSVYFKEKAQFATRTPTRYIPTQTATVLPHPNPTPKSNIGPIVGGVVGGVVGVIIIAAVIWFCLRRRKHRKSEQGAVRHPTTGAANELTGESRRDTKSTIMTNSMGSPSSAHSHPPLHYSSSPPPQPAYFVPYPYPAQDGQHYYPVPLQHPSFGYQQPMYPHMATSPPDGIYPQQAYFPPPEVRRPSAAYAYEMPISRTPATDVQHVERHSTPHTESMQQSLSDLDSSRFRSSPPTHHS